MPINIVTDDLIALERLVTIFPNKQGKPRSIKSILRWVIVGVKGAHKREPVRLEAKRVGGSWFTTEDAIRRFSNQTTEHVLADSGEISSRAAPKHSVAHRRATAKLKARGMVSK